jgi:hypothetical protein
MSVLLHDAWLDFVDTVSRRTDGTWIFRGHCNSSWTLTPSVGRREVLGTAPYRAADERVLFDDYKREVQRFETTLEHDIEWLALAQHHGLPTRLLDWTTNSFVAAWFAVESETISADGTVHMLRIKSDDVSDDLGLDIFAATAAEPMLVRVPPRAARLTAQQGLFSLHPDPTASWTPVGPSIFYDSFNVPLVAKPFFRQALHAFGFDRQRLMTDLDGLCATLAWGYRTRA